MSKLKVGDIVYTASEVCVVDIGWVECTDPLVIQARANKWNDTLNPARYGGVQYNHWHNTNKSVTEQEWQTISYEQTTENICNKIGMSYYISKTQKSEISEPHEYMNSSIITQVLYKLIGPTSPVGDSYVDDGRLNNLRTLIDVINWGLDGLLSSTQYRHRLEYSIRANGETAYSAINKIKIWCEEVLEKNQ